MSEMKLSTTALELKDQLAREKRQDSVATRCYNGACYVLCRCFGTGSSHQQHGVVKFSDLRTATVARQVRPARLSSSR